MSNTYSQIYIHIVFAVKNRASFIQTKHREEIHKYISGIVNTEHKLLSIYAMPDHVHILVSFNPAYTISDLVKKIKTGSANFINKNNLSTEKFSWQESYGAFSYSKSQIDNVIKYILNQENHHQTRSFKDEYIALLTKLEIQFEDKYLFEWFE